jgi:hypothetical protein
MKNIFLRPSVAFHQNNSFNINVYNDNNDKSMKWKKKNCKKRDLQKKISKSLVLVQKAMFLGKKKQAAQPKYALAAS